MNRKPEKEKPCTLLSESQTEQFAKLLISLTGRDTFGQAVEKEMYNLTPGELEYIAEGNRGSGWSFTREELEEAESEYRQAASTGDHHTAALLVSALEDCNYHGFCRALLAGDFEAYRRELDEVSPILEAYGDSEKSLIRATA